MKYLRITGSEWRLLKETIVWAEYVNREVHWAEGSPVEMGDSPLDKEIMRNWNHTCRKFKKAISIIERARGTRESRRRLKTGSQDKID